MNQFMALVYPKRSHEVDELTGRIQRTKARRAFFNSLGEAQKFVSKQNGKVQIVDQQLRMTVERKG
jgi:hypothetical protein